VPATDSSPRPRRDAGTEARILDAARAVFTSRGTAGARMQEIADRAGVNSALLYYYFRSKDALAERVFLDAASRLFAAVAPLAASGNTVEELVRGFVHNYIDSVRQAPFLPGYVVGEMHQHPARMQALIARVFGALPTQVGHALVERIGGLIMHGVATGTIRPQPPRQLLVSVLALCVMPFVARPMIMEAFALDDPGFDAFLDERKRELPDFILRGLRP
jgi:TetR/AcrR family transcriptional regulator